MATGGTVKLRPGKGLIHRTRAWMSLVCEYKQDLAESSLYLFPEGECTKYLRGWHVRPITYLAAGGTLRLGRALA